MGLWDKLTGELVDIVEWVDATNNTMVWRFPRYQNEIKYGAKLVVRESQVGIVINQGKLADVFVAGTYTLDTQNLPILSTLLGWKYGFHSPFKAEVYFVSMRTFTDRKWGTKNPIMMRDAEFGPVRLRAFGSFAIKVSDPAALLRNVVGTEGLFTIEKIDDQLCDLLVARFADVLGESKIPVLDLAGNQDELGKFLITRLQPDFDPFGLKLGNLVVENISLPEAVEAALDKRTSMGVIGNMQAFMQFETASAIKDAAQNPGGLAGVGAGLGAGFAMANQVGQAMAGPSTTGQAMAGPPPIPQVVAYHLALDGAQQGPFTIDKLRELVTSGRLMRDTLAWKNGMPQWAAAESISDLAALFANVPPPLPK